MSIASSSQTAASSCPPSDLPKRKPRTIVLCFDGTGNEYEDTNTNVVKLYSVLRKDKAENQVCYYQPGIGTYFAPGVVRPFFRQVARRMDEAFAWYLCAHVLGGYKFLMQNYDVGDKVCIFGFSRGAYTARALAGMLHKVGLLSKDNMEQVSFAYKLYKSKRPKNVAIANGFKATFCRSVIIDFVGVWDTVASVGLLKARSLPFVDVNTTIRVFRQALSLDEHRAKFRPNLHFPDGKSSATSDRQGIQPGAREKYETDVKEVWFAGSHSDVGGGVALDTEKHALSNISLRWMIKEAMQARCPILFDHDEFDRWCIPCTIGQNCDSSPPNGQGTSANLKKDGPGGDNAEKDEYNAMQEQDAVQKITDELKKNILWWILEVFPVSFTYKDAQGKSVTTWWPHLGSGRKVPPHSLFHESVKIRMEHPILKYKPRARYHNHAIEYVS